MITFFTTAKAFIGHNGMIQRNALKSWKVAAPRAEVILFGNDEGAAEAARELGIRHVPEVRRAHQGPKFLSSVFDTAQQLATHEVLCYANCDIVLTKDFLHAVNVVDVLREGFLMVGRRRNVDLKAPIEFERQDWEQEFSERGNINGRLVGAEWIDYFVFPRGFYLGKLPEFVIGRVYWDQWLVWKARASGAALVDASDAVMAIHQNHDYGYHPAGKAGVWNDELARRNLELAGGRWHLCTIDDATHVLGLDGLRENPARRKRLMERYWRTAKNVAWMTALDWTRPVRRAVGIGKEAGIRD